MNRSNSWIQTFTGKKFFPLDPHPDEVCIEDIAHALSNICRFTGHCRSFYSVAQHSALVSQQLVSPIARCWGLLHDASEAYIADLASPIKSGIANYAEIEERLMRVIACRFDLYWPMPDEVKQADLVLLHTERRDLMAEPPEQWSSDRLSVPLEQQIIPWDNEIAEIRFMGRFDHIFRAAV